MARLYPLYFFDLSELFTGVPKFALGAGFQLGFRGGQSGIIFFDVNYMYYIGDTVMKNDYPDYPFPKSIHYMRHALGLGVGYKIGFVDRK